MDSGARRTHSSRRVLSMGIEGEEEFQEEDVWSVLRDGETSGPEVKIPKSHFSSSSSSSSPWHIHRSKEVSGVKQSSAPMNVPDWSKVYGDTKSNRRSSNHLYSHDDEDDEDDGCMVPPHEWVARKLARTQISSFSMCEGIGRTLKGRDLSKVRNAVLTKTGFLE
ncbi:Protein S40-4 [Cardamine amara subsp. amara]|uniref:Protein S40-4 n=1 Tax=Cardamine amara subsp. amara TaxID=228776 RepID=A0ABD0ZP35_CARAN